MAEKLPRLVIRVSPEDDAWLVSESERMGCDKDNLVRMMIRQARVGQGAPVAPQAQSRSVAASAPLRRPVSHDDAYVGPGADLSAFQSGEAIDADPTGILASRLAEVDAASIEQPEPAMNGAAVSLRRVERERYNPMPR